MIKYIFTTLIFLLAFILPNQTHGFMFEASDVLGQTDGSGGPVFDTDDPNDGQAGPNEWGFGNTSHGLVLDSKNHRLFVSDVGNNRIMVFKLDEENNLINRRADWVLGQDNFTSTDNVHTGPNRFGDGARTGLAYDKENDWLFVSDSRSSNNERILIFDLSNGISNGMDASWVLGQDNFTDQGEGLSASRLKNTKDLTYDQKRQWLFAGDMNNRRVLIFDLSSGITNGMDASWVLGQDDFVSSEESLTQNRFASGIYALTYDNDNQRLFTYDNRRVLVFDVRNPGSNSKEMCGYTSSGIANGMNASCVIFQPDFTTGIRTTSINRNEVGRGLEYSHKNKWLIFNATNSRRVVFVDVNPDTLENDPDAFFVIGQPDFETDATHALDEFTMRPWMGVVFDDKNNRLYVGSGGTNRILIYDLLNPNSPQNHTIGSDVSFDVLNNSQGNLSHDIKGDLPNGLELFNPSISGEPSQTGEFVLNVEATDVFLDIGSITIDDVLRLIINPKPVDSTPSNSIEGQVKNLISIGNKQAAQKLMDAYPHLFVDKRKGLSREQSSAIIGFLASFGVSESILENVASVLTN